MAYETEQEERKRITKERKRNAELLAERAKRKERDMATRYKDGVIYSYIQLSTNEYLDAQSRTSAAMSAQAMIAYNEMIDRRWRK